ncbi:hypothetical protein Tco_0134705 [Tanacetum coccineum]
MDPPKFLEIGDLGSDIEYVDTHLISLFLDSDDESNDGAHIESELSKVVMAKPFKDLTHLEDDCTKGLILFSRIWDTNIFQMPRTIPKLKNLGHYQWSRIPPFLVLSDKDRMSGLKYSYEKNKLIYKGSLNLGPEYQVDEEMKEWLIRGHVRMHEAN